ncbi:MAG: RNA pseudouridine synthase [Treponemataceae bacterium]|nr:RNA pseudouridine synthase [Spirochaetales bacterium]MDY6031364.1 RNA pseudouridine synthase [Treponemataceae bacterium]
MQDCLERRIIVFYDDFCIVTKYAGENAETDIPRIFEPVIKKKLGKEPEIISCPHRLDMPVGGVQIIAFTKKTFEYFTNVFSNKLARKTYFAIVEGVDFPQKEGRIENYLVFSPEKKKAFVYDYEKRKSKKAILNYQIFAQGDRYSYLIVEPKTGRTHQIRAQLASRGMHIKGDVKYGARRSDTIDGIRLFAYSIEMPLQKNDKNCSSYRFEAQIPVLDSLWQDFLSKYKEVEL